MVIIILAGSVETAVRLATVEFVDQTVIMTKAAMAISNRTRMAGLL